MFVGQAIVSTLLFRRQTVRVHLRDEGQLSRATRNPTPAGAPRIRCDPDIVRACVCGFRHQDLHQPSPRPAIRGFACDHRGLPDGSHGINASSWASTENSLAENRRSVQVERHIAFGIKGQPNDFAARGASRVKRAAEQILDHHRSLGVRFFSPRGKLRQIDTLRSGKQRRSGRCGKRHRAASGHPHLEPGATAAFWFVE